jgi:WNK lysine deficient protein kinase
MEALETPTSRTAPETPATRESNVDHGTVSTSAAHRHDDSVISAVSDHAALAVNSASVLQMLVEAEEAKQEVAVQVIVSEDSNGIAHTLTSSAPDDKIALAAATPVLPDPPSSAISVPSAPPSPGDDTSCEPAVTTPSPQTNVESNTQSLDDYIRSPEIQNAIVERSPGSRYVRFMEKLGSGASKDVYRAYDTQEGIEVAWNVVNLSGVPKNERNRIVNEVRLLERLHHHNIISFHGSWVNRERQEVNFVTEILSSGTLKSFINKVQVIRWKIAKRWAAQILTGLEYLHSQDPPIIHRDLKCENIFINGTSGDLRIGDLGLSTVHRNGRVLSVLGTPEFMAPDMYEENSYDEKVDIYAFGMCVLEIFTKEIPYSECSNPAQIYMKVSSGEPPEVLSRLQSKHARDFIMLCLGYKDESDKYVRPSASELLKHPFLEKRASDDNEVVVDKPLRERSIAESRSRDRSLRERAVTHSGESSIARAGTPSSKRPSTSSEVEAGGVAAGEQPLEPPSMAPPRPRRKSIDEEDGDRFEEMPESETNMKKVKVLMGRGRELKEEEETTGPDHMKVNQGASGLTADSGLDSDSRGLPQQSLEQQSTQPNLTAATPQQPPTHLLVAAAVLENENPAVRPYADDILKLVVTLPVEGQTRNVQFDFHLVGDDPVQVAKEMVLELGIPQGAVLEISETISALACAARMRIDKYSVAMQHSLGQRQSQAKTVSQPQLNGQQHGPSQAAQQDSPQLSSASPIPEYTQAAVFPSGQQVPHAQPSNEQGHLRQNSQVPHQLTYILSEDAYSVVPIVAAGDAQPPLQPLPPPMQAHTQQQQQAAALFASGPFFTSLTPASGSTSAPQQVQHLPRSIPSSKQNPMPLQFPLQQTQAPGHTAAPLDRIVAVEKSDADSSPSYWQDGQGSGAPTDVNLRSHSLGIPPLVQRNGTAGSAPQQVGETSSSTSSLALVGDELDSEYEEDLSDEMRQLELDYQKNLQRAKKVFDNRMDNLQRSQIEREAQYQKTLEKHEKERVEFERRLAQEAEQQNKRIEQLQREWEKRREDLSQKKLIPKNINKLDGVHPESNCLDPTSTDPGHSRSVSNASSCLSMSPMMIDRKNPKDANGSEGS